MADENKKLRMLLNQNGVGDDTIEAFLQSTAGPDTVVGQGFGCLRGVASGAVQVLEHLLNTRKPYCTDGNTGAPGPVTTTTSSRDSSSGSLTASTVQSMWDPSYNGQMRSQNDQGTMSGSGKAPQHQFMTSGSAASQTSSAASTGQAGTASAQQHQHHHHQQQQQQQHHPLNRMPSLAPSVASTGSTVTTSSQQTQPLYDFDTQVSMRPSYHGHQHRHSHGSIAAASQLAPAPAQSHPLGPVSPSGHYLSTPSPGGGQVGGTNNCVFATDMIATMAGGDPRDVRADLGCLTAGMECEVDNQLVFSVMDRYVGQGIGL